MTDAVEMSGPAFDADPYTAYAKLRRDAPVHTVPGPLGSEIWLITRYEDVRTAFSDPRFAKDPRHAPEWARVMAGGSGDEGPMGRNMLNSDPPDHTRQRRLVSRAFTPRRVELLRPRVRQIAEDLADGMTGRPQVDLMADFAHPLPMTVICELLGIDMADRASFAHWTRMLLASPATQEGIESRRQGNRSMDEYLGALIQRMRPHVSADLEADDQPDLLSAMMTPGREDQLAERELIGMVKLLIVAGHETTVNHIGNGMLALLQRPDQLALLREQPELIPGAIDELLRYDGPIERVPLRYTTDDVPIGGVTIPKGSAVNIVLAAADRDTDQFPAADTLDVTRRDNKHMAFGHGIHYCLGAPLARMEGQIAFRTLLDRFDVIELACPPDELVWRIGGPRITRGLDTLPLRLRSARSRAA